MSRSNTAADFHHHNPLNRPRPHGLTSSSGVMDRISPWQRPESRSAPLPQTQWANVPEAYRPRDWTPSEHRSARPLPPQPTYSQLSAIPQIDPRSLQIAARSEPSARRLRPVDLRKLPRVNQADPSLLYPQLSPHDMPGSSSTSAQHLDYAPRSVSQPSFPHLLMLPHNADKPLPSLPRAPAHPPMTRRRRHRSTSNMNDPAFRDEEEFRLFLEATTGIGPIPTFRQNSLSESPQPPPPPPMQGRAPREPRPEHTASVSPMEETPTTVTALHHLAQMPRSASPSPERHHSRTWPVEAPRHDLDIWVHPPAATSTRSSEDWLYGLEEHHGPDDELPDYAASQAQAQAETRRRAANRAEELQRRWRASMMNA